MRTHPSNRFSLGLFLAPGLLLVLVALWALGVSVFRVSPLILPGPDRVFFRLIEHGPHLVTAAALTLFMALKALVLAFVLAGLAALLGALSPPVQRALRPLLIGLQVTPIVAIAPLIIIWTGLDHPDRAVTLLAAIIAFFPIYSGLTTGLDATDPGLEDLFRLYGANRIKTLFLLKLPSSLPHLIEGLRVATGLSVIGAVVAEFVAGSGASRGLAFTILDAGQRLKTDLMIAALIVLALMAFGLHHLVDKISALARPWRQDAEELKS